MDCCHKKFGMDEGEGNVRKVNKYEEQSMEMYRAACGQIETLLIQQKY